MTNYANEPLSSQREGVEKLLAKHKLRHGVGDTKSMCTVAAINLALTDKVTDEQPDCMSSVIHAWVITVQDELPLDRLRSPAWTDTVPLAVGTNDGRDAERLALIMDWMWGTVLPQLQPLAVQRGIGAEWLRMCQDRTAEAARSVVVRRAFAPLDRNAFAGAEAAEWAARAEEWAARAAEAESWKATAAEAADRAARVLEWAAKVSAQCSDGGDPGFWGAVDAEGLFWRLCCLNENTNQEKHQ